MFDSVVIVTIDGEPRWVAVDASRFAGWIDRFAARHGAIDAVLAMVDQHQVVQLTATDQTRACIVVPYPPLDDVGSRLVTALTLHVQRSRRVGVLIVRRGGYAVGIFHGAELVTSKVGSRYVQGQTKAGGWSQQRYRRRRDNQAAAAFGEASDVAVRLLGAEVDRLDAVRCGGDRLAVTDVLADTRLAAVAQLAHRPAPPGGGDWLRAGDPKLAVLKSMSDQIRSVRIGIFDVAGSD